MSSDKIRGAAHRIAFWIVFLNARKEGRDEQDYRVVKTLHRLEIQQLLRHDWIQLENEQSITNKSLENEQSIANRSCPKVT